MKNLNCLLLTSIVLINSTFAQNQISQPEMADIFMQHGKFYVVVGVILIIFAVLIFYLIRLDLKIKKLEQNIS